MRSTFLTAALTAAVITGPVGGGVQPVMASGDSNIVRPDDGRLAYEGHWGRTADAATTVNSGSRLTFRFSGDTAHALFDVSSITVPAQIYVSVDGGPKRLYAVDRNVIAIEATGRGPHTAEVSAYPTLVADALHASLTQVGFGRQGVIQTGNGGVPAAQDAYGWNYAGSSADPDRRADVIVVNQGTNDAAYGPAEFRAAYRAYLGRLRSAAPRARILALRPFDGTHADDIAAVVDELADRRVEFVDTSDWLSLSDGDFNGTVHPSVQGHRKAADRLIALIAKEL